MTLAGPRFGPLPQQSWPQMDNRVPRAMAHWMPPLESGNVRRAQQESFTMSGSFVLTAGCTPGQQFALNLLTDQDGDFWCDQIYMVAWGDQMGPDNTQSALPGPGVIDIVDQRTNRALNYPLGSTPVNFFATLILFSEDIGFDVASSPLPDGYRSTSTIAQPFCFTRAGGILCTYTTAMTFAAQPNPQRIDIAFGGWKEYAYASQG